MSGPTPSLPVVAFTVAVGETSQSEARLCEASFRHWHPDIPFLCIDDELYRLISGGRPPAWSGEIVSIRSMAGWLLSRHAQRVIQLDGDLFVLGRLEGLLDTNETIFTADLNNFTMRVPEAPLINDGVLASSDPALWQAWTSAQFGYLVPALKQYYFDQLSLRLLVMAGALQGRILDGRPGLPYYNISIDQQPGEWRVDQGVVYKGTEKTLIYHQAGHPERGISGAPPELRAHLEELTRDVPSEKPDALVRDLMADGESFSAMIKEQLIRWPIATLEDLLPDVYASTPGYYRSVAPVAYDRLRKMEGTGWDRSWNRDWQAYLYFKKRTP